MFIVYLSGAWLAGIALGYYLGLPPILALAGLVPACLVFCNRRRYKPLLVSGIAIVLVVAGSNYTYARMYRVSEDQARFYNDQGATALKGLVNGAPDVRDTGTRLTLAASAIEVDGAWRAVSGKVLVVVPRYPAYRYGDLLQVGGGLETPGQFSDFDYRGYLANQGIYAVMYYPRVEVQATGRGFKPLAWIYALRRNLSGVLGGVLPEPQAALAQGIVLGIRSNIPADLQNAFATSGTTHLLAISGLNIGIMAGVLLAVALWLFGRRRYLYIYTTLGAVWWYAIITGLNPPVLRGAIVASIFLCAEGLGRQRSAVVALCLAAAVMAGLSPYVLGDASFQLSFLAMLGLIFVFPLSQAWGRKLVAARLGEQGALVLIANITVDTWSATLAATLAVWPVVAYHFGFVSLVGPLATFIAVPALPLIIVTGMLAGLLGLVSLTLAQIAGWLAWPFLTYLIIVVRGLAAPAVASIEVGKVGITTLAVYYAVLIVFIIWRQRRRTGRGAVAGISGRMKAGLDISFGLAPKLKWVLLPLALVAVLVTYTAATMPGNDLRVSFLDVGEGDAILIQQGSRQVLVDGGPSPDAITRELSRQMPFWDRTIDILILTHPHQDHLAGLVEVLRRYRVGQVLYPAIEYDSSMNDEWARLIGEKGVKTTAAGAGQRIALADGALIEVLSPQADLLSGTVSDIDNNSVVLRVTDGAASFILTGDIQGEAERELIRERAAIAGAVLKAAHHGSDTSSTAGFLAVADPRAVVVSCGTGNRFGHPVEDVLERLGEKVGAPNVYRTDMQGTITFTTDGQRLWVAAGK